jgi:hypothetical protein
MYLVILGLFNDTLSKSGYIVLNGRMNSEWWIGKAVEGTGHGLILGTLLMSGGTEENCTKP